MGIGAEVKSWEELVAEEAAVQAVAKQAEAIIETVETTEEVADTVDEEPKKDGE